jgi:hypothetical protein
LSWFFILVSRETKIKNFLVFFSPIKFFLGTTLVLFLLNWQNLSYLNTFFIFRVFLWSVAYGTAGYLFYQFYQTQITKKVAYLFVSLSTIQSFLSFFQFISKKSIGFGLNKLGEQIISPEIHGVAKIVSDETVYIRGYGTFAHPNVLAAFLSISALILVYLLFRSDGFKAKLGLSSLFFINFVGLICTFSRSGLLGFGLSFITLIFFFAYKSKVSKEFFIKLSIFLTIICLNVLIFSNFLIPRGNLYDSASMERLNLTKIGLQIVKNNPLFGVGMGESLIHMNQYSENELKPWEYQPIHNFWLLAGAEIGIFGFFSLIWVFFSHWLTLAKNFKGESPNNSIILFIILLNIFVLMQFDHYFYTLVPAQMLLWVILGIVSVETKKAYHE